jgi:hypothetical protein
MNSPRWISTLREGAGGRGEYAGELENLTGGRVANHDSICSKVAHPSGNGRLNLIRNNARV